MSYISVAREDFSLGVPLPWVVYDEDGNDLMEQGAVIETEDQLQSLLARNPLRVLAWNTAAPEPQPEASEADNKAFDAALADAAENVYTFDDMRLRVGDRIQLQPPATVGLDRYIVKLIGWVDKVSLLVTAPLENGFRLPLRENDKIVARIFSSQNAFGFSTVVERVCKIPYNYLHLSFPDQIQGAVIRKAPRVRTNIITSITRPGADGSGDKRAGIIVNLSADGAFIKSRQPICEKGQTVQLAFRVNLHNVDAYLVVSAIVRSTFADESKDGSEGMFSHGVQFLDLAPNDSVILQSMIYQQMIEHPDTLT